MRRFVAFWVLWGLCLPLLALAQGRPERQPSVPLEWDFPPPHPDTFLVERRPGPTTSAEPFALVATLPGTTRSWEDTTATPATSYCWQVRAVIAPLAPSTPTDPFCVHVPTETPAPTNLRGAVKRPLRDGETRP